ncbi:hypothetical protein PROFUN_14270 [Planoprotostelium fungivorum]|uniref:Transmembrane protein n=1 Tax=Planoprotostelium fungivorum TaxID=1890364 RepID=A0A2P6N0E2_9EUKA|nr:hypothetical protein PROFUN_14270 [Planoprotostelium fungivorum]
MTQTHPLQVQTKVSQDRTKTHMWNPLGYSAVQGQDITSGFNLWRLVSLVWAVTALLMGVTSFACAQEGELAWPYELGVGSAGMFYAGLGFFGIVAILTKRSHTVVSYCTAVVAVMTAVTIYYLYRTIVRDHKVLRPLLCTLAMAAVCTLWTVCNYTYLMLLKKMEQLAATDVEASVLPQSQPPPQLQHPTLPAHLQNAPSGYDRGIISSQYIVNPQQQGFR